MTGLGERRRLALVLCERDGGILLVRRSEAESTTDGWMTPVYEAQARRFPELDARLREETGLTAAGFEAMRFFVQVLADESEPETLLFGISLRFEGELRAGAAARFVPLAEAVELLAQHPDRALREPLLGYLSGERADEAGWAYRRTAEAELELIVALAAAPPGAQPLA